MSTNRDFDRIAGAWLAEGPTQLADRVLDAALREVHLTPQRHRWSAPWRAPLLSLRLTAAGVIAVVAIAGILAFNLIGGVGPQPTAAPPTSSAPSSTASPSAAASATAEAEAVRGWPGNRGSSAPGLYSWDEVTCEPTNCLMGVLHRHYEVPNNDVRIAFDRIPEWSVDAGATPITVAGHQGRYQRTNAELEVWNVAFDKTLVSISLSVESGTSKEVVDEAHSIIESLVYEPRETPLGFRLVFRLPSSLWDSPF